MSTLYHRSWRSARRRSVPWASLIVAGALFVAATLLAIGPAGWGR